MKKRASSSFSTHNKFIDKANHISINSKELKTESSKSNNSKNKSAKSNFYQGKFKY